MRVIVIGAGGHARVVLDILDHLPGVEVFGLVDDDPARRDSLVHGRPVIGDSGILCRLAGEGVDAAVVAVGDNQRRERLCGLARASGIPLLDAACHFSAVVSRHASLGAGTVVMPNAVVNAGARVGTGAVINTAAVVEHDCEVGDFSHIAPGARLGGAVRVGRGALVGIGATALPGVRIGDGATVGAATLVRGDIPAGAVACGVPARLQGGDAS